MLTKLSKTGSNLEKATQNIKVLMEENKEGLGRTLSNLEATSNNVKLATRDVRWQPWILLNKPDELETRDRILYNSSIEFSEGAEELQKSVRGLASLAEGKKVKKKALEEALKELRKHGKRKLHVLFGCGGDRDKGKRPLMAKAAEKLADHVTVTEDNPRSESLDSIFADIKKGFTNPEQVSYIKDRSLAIHKALKLLKAEDVLLLAGKGHENYQEKNGKKEAFSEKQAIHSYKKERKA